MYRNEIICGDAREVLAGVQSESVDFVLTDPPYLVNYRDREGRSIAGDRSPAVLDAFLDVARVLKPNRYCISFYGWTNVHAFTDVWARAGLRTVGHIVWHKPYASKTGFAHYRHESAFILAKGRPEQPAEPIDDVQPWTYSGNKAHPTEKSVDILTPLIRSFSRPGDLVLDPFSGSGSTAVAAALSGRDYFSIELDEDYCAYARKRLAGVTRYQSWDQAA